MKENRLLFFSETGSQGVGWGVGTKTLHKFKPHQSWFRKAYHEANMGTRALNSF